MTIPDDALAALAEVVGSGSLRSGEAIPARNRKDASRTKERLPAPVSYTHLDVYKRQA